MSLRVFASAFILIYTAVGSEQTAGWEEQRRGVIELRQHGRLREALEAAQEALADAERHEPGAEPLPLALHDYAIINGDLALHAEAEKAIRRAIRILEVAPTRDDRVIQIFQLRLAEVYLDAGRHKDAKALFLELQRIWEQTRPQSAELAMALDHLAWIEALGKNFAAAESLLQRSIGLLDAGTEMGASRMGDILNDYASLLYSLKRYAEATKYCERVLALFSGQDTDSNPTLINTWTLLGASYANTGRNLEAETYVRRATAAAQSMYGEDSLRSGRQMAVAAVVLKRCGQSAEAKSLKKKSDQILAKAGREDPGRFTIDVHALR